MRISPLATGDRNPCYTTLLKEWHRMCDINSINNIFESYTYKHIDKYLYVIMCPMCIYSFYDNPSNVRKAINLLCYTCYNHDWQSSWPLHNQFLETVKIAFVAEPSILFLNSLSRRFCGNWYVMFAVCTSCCWCLYLIICFCLFYFSLFLSELFSIVTNLKIVNSMSPCLKSFFNVCFLPPNISYCTFILKKCLWKWHG